MDLNALRRGIDELTRELVQTLEKRAAIASSIAELKRREGLPARDRLREARLLEATVAEADGVLTKRSLLAILHKVIDVGLAQRGVGSDSALVVAHGAATGATLEGGRVIAGPLAVEDEAQIEMLAARLASLGVGTLQGGAFGLEVSPYAHAGLGLRGVELLAEAAHRHGMRCVTEVLDVRDVVAVAERVDMIRVGARSMHSVSLLREVARAGLPVILERGLGASLREWLSAAEQIACAGDAPIVLAERGVRGVGGRALLDLASVAEVKRETGLPVMVDVSHAADRRELVAPLTRAALAVGADAVAIRVHPDPDMARANSASQLDLEGLEQLLRDLPRAFRELARSLDTPPQPAVTTASRHAHQAERNAP
ncbi:MAG: chorismate mutase [Deltaproteobacteria bacterium]|nr:chorismate mutase [Deltaproteobacteria bacterium]